MEKAKYSEIQKQIKELQNKEIELITTHMPKFERGIVEAALEREHVVWDDIQKVFGKHSIMPSVRTRIISDNQPSQDPSRPLLACAGVAVDVSYIIQPVDLTGKSGKLPSAIVEQVANIRQRIAKLTQKVEDE